MNGFEVVVFAAYHRAPPVRHRGCAVAASAARP